MEKGKTSFLHFFASKLAQQYLKTHEGLFPIYINLNEYDKFANAPTLGVLANFLAKRFKIDIKEDYFKKKNFFFLVDSLDECGELTEVNIERVIKDVVEIQNLDNINQRNNRIIIASRPIAKGLREQITKYKPFVIKPTGKQASKTEATDNYISVYGFKKEQFDSYIEFALKSYLQKEPQSENQFTGISDIIFSRIAKGEKINVYSELYDKVLKDSELKRPIFSYMIYKLIISNSNFIDFGKVGVYISFLNQLSRDAKHKDDCNHKVSLKDEFVYRNVLHASALLWQYKRQSGEQTSLTKADICRTIEEDEIDRDDRTVLTKFKDIESIHFLSHSYLGEKENTLHFQHQSFAEILLAEYYLKIIIKYAFDENASIEEARVRLSIGLPTDQTIEFFQGLLALLKECVAEDKLEENSVYAKRELLIPLLASMAINEHNKKLYSTRLNLTWFEKYQDDIFSANKLNDKIIKDFPITQKMLNKIEVLCQNIIGSTKAYFLDEPSRHTVLFKKELMSLSTTKGNSYEIDKWFALIAGNILSNNIQKKQFFNSQIHSKHLFRLIKNWNYNLGKIPYWGVELFIGINMVNNDEYSGYEFLDLNGINFSYSYLKQLYFNNSNLVKCDFSHCVFEYFNIIQSNITSAKFDNIDIKEASLTINDNRHHRFEGIFSLTFCFIAQGVLFPHKLNNILKGKSTGLVNFGTDFSTIQDLHVFDMINDRLHVLKGLFRYIILQGENAEFIISAFRFELNDENQVHSTKHKKFKKEFADLVYSIEKEPKNL